MIDLLKYRHWAIDVSYLNDVYPTISKMITRGKDIGILVNKKTVDDFLSRIEALMYAEEGHPPVDAEFSSAELSYDSNVGLPVAKTSEGNVAIIPVVGPLTKYGDLCSYGMQDYQSMLAKANKADNIVGTVLLIDSPGGTVDGTPEFGLAVKNSTKPVGVFGDSLVASAALWVASQSDVIVGNKNNPTEFGSIGTLAMKQDYSKPMKKGYMQEVKIIRAPQSTDKALVNSFEPMTDDIALDLKNDLKNITDQFIDTVKAGREGKIDATVQGLFTGKTFDVYDAKKAGLIDSVGTLNTAVSKVAELAKSKRLQNNSNTNMSLLSFLGKSKEEKAKLSADDQAKLAEFETKLSAVESELSTVKVENGTLTEKVNGLSSDNAALKATIAGHEATIKKNDETIASQKAELEKTPAGQATTVLGAGDDKLEKAGLDKYKTSIDDDLAKLREQNKSLELK